MGLVSMLSVALMSALSWIPSDVSQFWVEPSQPAFFEFNVDGNSDEISEINSVNFLVKTTDGELFQ